MANEWQEVQLGGVADLITGHPFKSQNYTDDISAARLIGGDNIAQGCLRWENVRRWPVELTDGLDAYWLKRGDVVLAMDRPWIEAGLKRAAIGEQDVPSLLVQRTARIRGSDELDNGFLRYVIGSQAFTQYILSVQTGTAVPHISPTQIRTYSFLLPPLEEQRAIAHILGTLDDKIELNRKQNETLEAMARALFKAWFVDFEPVRAKMEGRWQRGQSLPGLPAHLYDLFPDRLVESELGEIPEGWERLTLRELSVVISKGTTPSKSILDEASDPVQIEFLKVKDISEGGEVERKSLELIAKSIHEGPLKRSILKQDDLLFSIAGTIGRVTLIDADLEDSNCNQAIAFIRLKEKERFLSLCWLTLRSEQTQTFVESKVVQGVQANASLASIGAIPVLVATADVLFAWDKVVGPLLRALRENQSQSRYLAHLRDTLLPKLISGEIRLLCDTEKFVETVHES